MCVRGREKERKKEVEGSETVEENNDRRETWSEARGVRCCPLTTPCRRECFAECQEVTPPDLFPQRHLSKEVRNPEKYLVPRKSVISNTTLQYDWKIRGLALSVSKVIRFIVEIEFVECEHLCDAMGNFLHHPFSLHTTIYLADNLKSFVKVF